MTNTQLTSMFGMQQQPGKGAFTFHTWRTTFSPEPVAFHFASKTPQRSNSAARQSAALRFVYPSPWQQGSAFTVKMLSFCFCLCSVIIMDPG